MNATTIAPVLTAAERKSQRAAAKLAKQDKEQAAAAKRINDQVAEQTKPIPGTKEAATIARKEREARTIAGKTKPDPAAKFATKPVKGNPLGKLEEGFEKFRNSEAGKAAIAERDAAEAETTKTGYQGPMIALRERLKRGLYQKAANGQPSCGDEVAQILGALEPQEVIRACLIAMDITNPYLTLNIGQQSMNLRNKLRGQLKRNEIGMGVLREAVEEVIEGRPVKTGAQIAGELIDATIEALNKAK